MAYAWLAFLFLPAAALDANISDPQKDVWVFSRVAAKAGLGAGFGALAGFAPIQNDATEGEDLNERIYTSVLAGAVGSVFAKVFLSMATDTLNLDDPSIEQADNENNRKIATLPLFVAVPGGALGGVLSSWLMADLRHQVDKNAQWGNVESHVMGKVIGQGAVAGVVGAVFADWVMPKVMNYKGFAADADVRDDKNTNENLEKEYEKQKERLETAVDKYQEHEQETTIFKRRNTMQEESTSELKKEKLNKLKKYKSMDNVGEPIDMDDDDDEAFNDLDDTKAMVSSLKASELSGSSTSRVFTKSFISGAGATDWKDSYLRRAARKWKNKFITRQ